MYSISKTESTGALMNNNKSAPFKKTGLCPATIRLLIFLILTLVITNSYAVGEEKHGGIIIFEKPVKAVIFRHEAHLKRGLACKSCHPVLFAKKKGSSEEKEDFTMDAIYRGGYCGACHDGKKAFAADIDINCTLCHIGVRGYKRFENDKK